MFLNFSFIGFIINIVKRWYQWHEKYHTYYFTSINIQRTIYSPEYRGSRGEGGRWVAPASFMVVHSRLDAILESSILASTAPTRSDNYSAEDKTKNIKINTCDNCSLIPSVRSNS